jgi:hypothetical protein
LTACGSPRQKPALQATGTGLESAGCLARQTCATQGSHKDHAATQGSQLGS